MRSFICFTLLFSLLFTLTNAAIFTIRNQCPYTVWAAWAKSGPGGGGLQLNPGQSGSFNIPAGTTGGRVWGRTNCNFDGNGNGRCGTGDCGRLQCQGYGSAPNTLVEFALNQFANLDYVNLSVIDGFNTPLDFGGCLVLRCRADKCPDAYNYPTDPKQHTCPAGTNYSVVFCP